MLAEKVYNLNSFKHQYEALLTLSVCDTIPNLIWDKDKSDLLYRIAVSYTHLTLPTNSRV